MLKKILVSLSLFPIGSIAGDFLCDSEFKNNYSGSYKEKGHNRELTITSELPMEEGHNLGLAITSERPKKPWSIIHFSENFLLLQASNKNLMETISVLNLKVPQMSDFLFGELCNLSNLHTLDIEVTADLSKAVGLPDIELSRKGFSPLKNLKKLQTFSFSINNNFKEFKWDVLKNLELLENLTLIGVKLRSLPCFSTLKNIKSLNLSENSLEDFLWISHCTNLESLVLSKNKITYKKAKESVKKIKGKQGFKRLDLTGNQMTDEELKKIYKKAGDKIIFTQEVLTERML